MSEEKTPMEKLRKAVTDAGIHLDELLEFIDTMEKLRGWNDAAIVMTRLKAASNRVKKAAKAVKKASKEIEEAEND